MEQIRKAVLEDIPHVAAIYDRSQTEEEQGRAVIGWIRGVYPTGQTARDALRAGTLFVLERDGAIAAAAKIDQNQVSEYANAPWRYPDVPERQVMVLHTLVVDPAFRSGLLGGGDRPLCVQRNPRCAAGVPGEKIGAVIVEATPRSTLRGLFFYNRLKPEARPV